MTEFDTYYQVREVIKIDERVVNESEFDLDKSKTVVASLSALDETVSLVKPSEKQIKCYADKVQAASRVNGTKTNTYITFLLTEKGGMKFIKPYMKDEDELYKVAMNVLNKCGFKFTPGKINGETVSSQAVFPVMFKR